MERIAEKWARPDLDWRPSGYQPDAPTRLSYGPARPPNLMNRLKRSPQADGFTTRRGRPAPRPLPRIVLLAGITGPKRLLSSRQIGLSGKTWRPSRPSSR